MDPILFILLAVALGFKHSYDADHLVAVSNFLARSTSLRKTTLMSLSWAAGHMATASIITVLLYFGRDAFLSSALEPLEMAVAVMLIVLGVLSLAWEYEVVPKFGHGHFHRHDGEPEHEHVHVHRQRYRDHGAMFGIGIVHGLASNDELLILFVSALSVTSLAGLILGVAVFSAGVVVGMISFGLALTYPLRRWNERRVRRVVTVVAGSLSIAYGILILLGFGGFNPFGR
jgi:ABC-type nickel/cobalt efflux system permease component RcnA